MNLLIIEFLKVLIVAAYGFAHKAQVSNIPASGNIPGVRVITNASGTPTLLHVESKSLYYTNIIKQISAELSNKTLITTLRNEFREVSAISATIHEIDIHSSKFNITSSTTNITNSFNRFRNPNFDHSLK